MTTATILPLPRACFFDANGNPLASGLVYTYVAGTTTPKTTWQDAGETTPNTNPIVLDANGSCLLYGSGSYTLTVTDALGNNIPAYSGLTVDTLSQFITTSIPALASIAALRTATSSTLTQGQCYVLGYSSGADGGEGVFWYNAADTTSTDNGGTIIVDASNRRWYRETSGSVWEATWFGVKADNATDNHSTMAAAIAALAAAGGGTLELPMGKIVIGSTLTIAHNAMYLRGKGRGATVLVAGFAAGDFLVFGSSSTQYFNGGISDLTIDANIVRTSGASLRVTTMQYFTGERCAIDHQGGTPYVGVSLESDIGNQEGGSYYFNDFYVLGASHEGFAMGTYNAAFQVGGVFLDTVVCNTCGHGFRLTNVSYLDWRNVNAVSCTGNGILFDPASASSQEVTLGWFRGVSVDTNAMSGWDFEGTGIIGDIMLDQCAANTNTLNGFRFASTAINGVAMHNCRALANDQNGALLFSGKNIQIVGGQFFNNSISSSATYSGINVAAGVSNFQINSVTSGAGGFFEQSGLSNAQGWGIIVGVGASDSYVIALNRCPGNITGGVSDGGTGVNKYLAGNIT